ncbi:oxygenase MpaB family protein [Nocardia sp. NBC_01009]|uniref:oxygenase MpaB family protein n=1 Tax=Nocardia sp. NBC_01009 TaxID=2975996 RepID=UPI0038673020|nr:oxygenase MpaB family protein [Nocardia sp. NBC_01009]
MTPPLRATTPEPTLRCRYGTADDFAIDEMWSGVAAFLGGTANVIMQLSLKPVAYGVMDSTVETGRVDLHPWKRLRTTLTYLAVAMMGTEEDRAVYREAVNQSHRPIHSEPGAAVKYNAFDPKLQLWVAACLYWGVVDLEERLHGPMDEDTAAVFYQYAARFGTTLQMRREMWPADRKAFAEYWDTNLATKTIDARTRAYFDHLIDLKMTPRPLRVFAPFQRFVATALLPPQLRDQMRMTWTARHNRLAVVLLRAIGAVHGRLPKQARLFPMNAFLYNMRRRHRLGKPLL